VPSYGGVAFRTVQDGWLPLPTKEPNWESSHIPYTNKDDVQFGGLGNEKLSVDVAFESAAAFASMEAFLASAAAAVTGRTLTWWGHDGTLQSSDGWRLRGIQGPKRAANALQQIIQATLLFEREA